MNATTLSLLDQGRFKEAVDFILSSYPDSPDGHFKAYNLFFGARGDYLKNESNRVPTYLFQLAALAGELEEGSEDRLKLEEVLAMRLADQNRLCLQRRQLFDDRDVDECFKKMRPCHPDFYTLFLLPERVFRSAKYEKARRRTDRIIYGQATIAPLQITNILSTSKAQLEKEINKPGDYYATVVALGVVSGRRTFEIVSTLYWEEVVGFPFQARVSGICKKGIKDFIDGEQASYTIPLLCPYDLFDHAMTAIRSFRVVEGKSDDKGNGVIKVGVQRATKELFGHGLPHTERRWLYTEMAWHERSINKFGFGMNRVGFDKHVLCHALFFPDATTSYSAAVMVESEEESD